MPETGIPVLILATGVAATAPGRAGQSKLHTIERAISLRGKPEHCRAGYVCYYQVENA